MWSKLLPLECSVWSLVKSYSKYLLLWAMHRHSNVYMVGRKFCNFGGDERPTFALMRMWWECLERKLGFPEMSPLGIHLPATPTFTTPTPTPPPTTQIVLWYVRVPIDISRKTRSSEMRNRQTDCENLTMTNRSVYHHTQKAFEHFTSSNSSHDFSSLIHHFL